MVGTVYLVSRRAASFQLRMVLLTKFRQRRPLAQRQKHPSPGQTEREEFIDSYLLSR